MQAETSSHVVATVRKNSADDLVVSLNEYRGNAFLDVRIYTAVNDQGPRPTRKGVTIRVDKIPELISALQQAEAEAERLGLLRHRGGWA